MKRLERGFRKTSKSFVKDFSPDLIHCHDLETLRTGIELKDEINCKVIFDSHEFEQNKNPPADPLTNEYIRNQERNKRRDFDLRQGIQACNEKPRERERERHCWLGRLRRKLLWHFGKKKRNGNEKKNQLNPC